MSGSENLFTLLYACYICTTTFGVYFVLTICLHVAELKILIPCVLNVYILSSSQLLSGAQKCFSSHILAQLYGCMYMMRNNIFFFYNKIHA